MTFDVTRSVTRAVNSHKPKQRIQDTVNTQFAQATAPTVATLSDAISTDLATADIDQSIKRETMQALLGESLSPAVIGAASRAISQLNVPQMVGSAITDQLSPLISQADQALKLDAVTQQLADFDLSQALSHAISDKLSDVSIPGGSLADIMPDRPSFDAGDLGDVNNLDTAFEDRAFKDSAFDDGYVKDSAFDDNPLPVETPIPQTGFIPNPHFPLYDTPRARSDKNRTIRLHTPLGPDAILVRSAYLTETLSQPFIYELQVFSEEYPDLQAEDLIGHSVDLIIDNKHGEPIVRNGRVTRIERLKSGNHNLQPDRPLNFFRIPELPKEPSEDDGLVDYRLIIEPWTQLLAPTNNYRIFQECNAWGVIEALFEDIEHKTLDAHSNVKTGPQRDYWVQFDESRIEFLHRICQSEGLGYYFIHQAGDHQLQFYCDDHAYLPPLDEPLIINPQTHDYDHLTQWQQHSHFVVGQRTQRAYNYHTPSQRIESKAELDPRVKDL